jgi:large subunit ribosomal protein L3
MNYTLLGKKLGMTQLYDGTVQVPVTVIQAGPCPVLQVKTVETDGYNAIQIGYETKKEKRASKAEQKHAKKNGAATPRAIREVRCDGAPEYNSGDVLDVTKFEEGQKIDIIGITKGRGFQGVMKRFNVKGGTCFSRLYVPPPYRIDWPLPMAGSRIQKPKNAGPHGRKAAHGSESEGR